MVLKGRQVLERSVVILWWARQGDDLNPLLLLQAAEVGKLHTYFPSTPCTSSHYRMHFSSATFEWSLWAWCGLWRSLSSHSFSFNVSGMPQDTVQPEVMSVQKKSQWCLNSKIKISGARALDNIAELLYAPFMFVFFQVFFLLNKMIKWIYYISNGLSTSFLSCLFTAGY